MKSGIPETHWSLGYTVLAVKQEHSWKTTTIIVKKHKTDLHELYLDVTVVGKKPFFSVQTRSNFILIIDESFYWDLTWNELTMDEWKYYYLFSFLHVNEINSTIINLDNIKNLNTAA